MSSVTHATAERYLRLLALITSSSLQGLSEIWNNDLPGQIKCDREQICRSCADSKILCLRTRRRKRRTIPLK